VKEGGGGEVSSGKNGGNRRNIEMMTKRW